MSYNITLEVVENEDGTRAVKVDEQASYLATAPVGRFVVSGHMVAEGEGGHQYAGIVTPLGERVSGGHDVPTPLTDQPGGVPRPGA